MLTGMVHVAHVLLCRCTLDMCSLASAWKRTDFVPRRCRAECVDGCGSGLWAGIRVLVPGTLSCRSGRGRGIIRGASFHLHWCADVHQAPC